MKKNSFLIFQLALLNLLIINQNCFAQALYSPPGIEWKRVDWYPVHPDTGPQTQDDSGEDWWYRHANSFDFDNSNVPNGFIAAGYSTFPNLSYDESATDGCAQFIVDNECYYDCTQFEQYQWVKGNYFAVLALISPNGREKIWTNYYNQGHFNNVIQTSDGGYLAVGTTISTRDKNNYPIIYNPGQLGLDEGAFFKTDVALCNDCILNVPHIMLVKLDSDGDVEWQYIYGMYPVCDGNGDYDPALATIAYQNYSEGWDVIPRDDGYLIVGSADPDDALLVTQPRTRNAIIIQVGGDGDFVSSEFYNSTGSGFNLEEQSKFTRIKKYEDISGMNYIVVGN